MNFLSPAFLYFLPLALLPVLFHILFKKKPVKITFSYVPLIKLADRTLMRKKKLHDLLLMLVRCLFLLFLVLFFSRPVLFSGGALSQEKEKLSLVILLDVSASMGGVSSGQTALQWAKAGLLNIFSRLEPETQVGMVVYANDVEIEMAPGTERGKMTALLNDLKPRSLSTNILPALELAYAMMKSQESDEKAILIVSDQFETGWAKALQAEGRVENFDPEVSVMAWEALGRVPNRGAVNVELGLSQAGSLTGQWTLARSGRRSDPDQWTFELNGKTVEKGVLPPDSKAKEAVSLQSDLSERGPYEGRLKVKNDELPFDDQFFVAGRFPKGYRLLAVDGEPGSSPADSEIYFLRSALETPVDPRLTSLRVVTEAEFNSDLLADTDVLLLANVKSVKDFQEAILSWVEKGGRVLLTAGDNWTSGPASPLSVFSKTTLVKQKAGVQTPGLDNDLLSGLTGAGEFQWSSLQVSQYLKAPPQPSDDVLLTLSNGDPLLLRRFRGNGEIMLLTSTLDRAWSNLASKPVFPPLARELAAFLGESTGRNANLNFFTGEPFTVPAPRGVRSATLIFPDGTSQGIRAGLKESFEFDKLEQPGVYQVKTGDEKNDFYFALNIKNIEEEGNTKKVGEGDLRKAFPGASVRFIPQDQGSVDAVFSALQGRNLTDFFLAGLILLFGIESTLGYRRKKK